MVITKQKERDMKRFTILTWEQMVAGAEPQRSAQLAKQASTIKTGEGLALASGSDSSSGGGLDLR